jgi:type I restriction enzyme R subunit
MAYSFSAFPEDAMVRIKPKEVKKTGKVPTNGSIFFTIFQSFMSGKDEADNPKPYFGEYPTDYFDFIIIDECHRGGARSARNNILGLLFPSRFKFQRIWNSFQAI